MSQERKLMVVSLGGSLIVPEEIDWEFIKNFKEVIERQIKKNNYKFILITGGGKTARKYQDSSVKITDLTPEDRDWLGIHATRMNAQFIRTIFREHAHPRVNTNPHDLEDFYSFKEDILVAAGWRPGFSTDYDAVVLARYLNVTKVANLSNIDYVYEKDPREFPEAKKIENISWEEFRKMVGDKWDPGMNVPFDPIASKLAAESKIEVAILNGKNLANLENYLEGKEYQGTTIN